MNITTVYEELTTDLVNRFKCIFELGSKRTIFSMFSFFSTFAVFIECLLLKFKG